MSCDTAEDTAMNETTSQRSGSCKGSHVAANPNRKCALLGTSLDDDIQTNAYPEDARTNSERRMQRCAIDAQKIRRHFLTGAVSVRVEGGAIWEACT